MAVTTPNNRVNLDVPKRRFALARRLREALGKIQ